MKDLILPVDFKNRIDTGGLILSKKFTDSHFELKHEIGVSGKYLVEVCRNGQVIRRPFGDEMIPNLITNAMFDCCLNTAGTLPIIGSSTYCRVGTGTTTPAAGNTDLVVNSQQTLNLLSGGTGQGITKDTVNGILTNTFVYEFAAVGAGITYNEMGVSNTATGSTLGSSAICTRSVFPTGVLCNAGDNIRITYAINWKVPSLVTPVTVSLAPVNGFDVSGQLKAVGVWTSLLSALANSSTNTSSLIGYSHWVIFNNTSPNNVALLSGPTSFPAVDTNLSETTISGATGTNSLGTYTIGSYSRTRTASWTPSQPSSTVSNVRMIRLCGDPGTVPGCGLYLLLTANQTKANTNTLAITHSCTMSAV